MLAVRPTGIPPQPRDNAKNMRRHRRAIAFAISTITIMGIAALFGFRKSPPKLITQLHYPVVVIPPDDSGVFIRESASDLVQSPMGANDIPVNGTTVIDAAFNFYQEQNVKCQQNEISMTFTALVRPGKPLTYHVDLLPLETQGRPAALELITKKAYLGTNPTQAAARRQRLTTQPTMADIVATFKQFEVELITPPDTTPDSTAPSE